MRVVRRACFVVGTLVTILGGAVVGLVCTWVFDMNARARQGADMRRHPSHVFQAYRG